MLVRVQSKCCFQMLLSKLGDKFFSVFVSCNKSGEVSKICRSTCVCIQYCILKCVAKLIISKHLFSFFRYNEGNNSIKYKNTNLLFFKHYRKYMSIITVPTNRNCRSYLSAADVGSCEAAMLR